MNRFGYTLTLLVGASLGLAACSDSVQEPSTEAPPPGSTTGGDGNTFDHDNTSVWDLIDRLEKEGPPSFTSHLHSCSKVRYTTLGNVLTGLGVNLTNLGTATAPTAGGLYKNAASALGTPNYVNRVRENIGITTSGASSEFDIFAAAAPEIITALPNLARCKDAGGAAPVLFNADNTCNLSGITCLIGMPATQGHVDICNQSITGASTPAVGKNIAVAAMLAAAYTCE